jgi:cyclopropane fatty-acyl-phospholipid synthase-like methyltransferase
MNKPENTEHIFDSFAQAYEEQYMDQEAYSYSLDYFGKYLNPDARMLDIGCGPGTISVYLQKKIPELRIFGIDLSRNMLELAKKNIPSGEFRKMDCRDLNRLEESFDAIVCGFCLPYLSQTEVDDLLQNAAALLNNKGSIYLSTMATDSYKSLWVGPSQGGEQRLLTHYHEADILRKTLEKNNFDIFYEERMDEQEREGTKFRDLIIIARKT